MRNKTFEIKILDSTSGIYEVLMERIMPTFRLELEKCNIVIKPNKDPNKEMVFIDLNIIRLLNYQGADPNKVGYRNIIINKLKGKRVTPMLYLTEAAFYEGIESNLEDYIKKEYKSFLEILSHNSEAIPDISFLSNSMVKSLIDMMTNDSNSNYEVNFAFLEKLYNDVFLSEENNLVNNMGNIQVAKKAFDKFKMIDVRGVDKLLFLCSSFSILSGNSVDPCFYDVFRIKKNKTREEQIKNTLGDIRNIRYLLYATSFIPNDVTFRFITNDNALFRVINELGIELNSNENSITYNFYGPNYDRIIHKNYKDNKDLYNDFIEYVSTILGK